LKQTIEIMKTMNNDLLDRFTDVTNRSKGQTNFLFDLCDGDFQKLVLLEEKIKNNFLSYCPDDKEEVEKILAMEDESGWYNLDQFKT
jgi:hypothetical protein